MTVLVTGTTGHVGQHLVPLLTARGHSVVAVVRPSSPQVAPHLRRPGVSILAMDLRAVDPGRLPRRVDAVVAVAQSSAFREFPELAGEVFAVNVTANLTLLDWAVQADVQRFVLVSSGGVYGGRRDGVLGEDDPPAFDPPLGFYFGTKLCAEILLQNYRHLLASSVVLRPFFIYGPGQRSDMFVARIIANVQQARPIQLQGPDGFRMNPVYVEDAAEAIARALDLHGHHLINVAGPDVVTLRSLSEQVGRLVGRSPLYEERTGQPLDYVASTARLRAQLGFSLTPLEVGLAKTLGVDEA